MIRVLIADDHLLVRDGLKRILNEISDILVTGEAGTGQEVLEKVREESYDVILLDISMPNGSGIDILSELKRCGQRVLVLTMHPEEQYAIRALKLGALGYITKQSGAEQLLIAIRAVAGGRRFITPALADALALSPEGDGEKAPHQLLSPREYQVFMLAAKGKSLKEVAGELFLSVKTVSTYRARILQKMEMKNFFEVIRYAVTHKLTD